MSSSKKRCGIDNCPSTRYEFQDGLLYCGEGHQQEVRLIKQAIPYLDSQLKSSMSGYTFTTNIHNSKGRRHRPTRILSSGKAERAERSARPTSKSQKVIRNFTIYTRYPANVLIIHVFAKKVYRGSEAFKVFLISYQHILQKQCYILIHTFGFPAKLEEVVKNELWAPRLQLLTARLETSDDDAPVFSSQAASDVEQHTKKGGQAVRRERESRSRVVPSLMDTLGMCYLAMIVLRLPISLGDLHG
ncbi:MAG: hypothetical protein Q9178_004193 [Gyalolechia marmorata]